jgi:hypothetical protein
MAAEVIVIGWTAARVMTSHLVTASGSPGGRFAVDSANFQFERSEPRAARSVSFLALSSLMATSLWLDRVSGRRDLGKG